MINKRFILFLILILCSCGVKENKEDAEKVVNEVFNLYKENKFKESFKFYDKAFFEATDEEKWLKILNNTYKKLGKLEEYKQTSWNIQSFVGTKSGVYYDFVYKVKYAKYDAVVRLRLFKPKDSTEIKIIGQKIDSEGFLLE